MRIDIQCVDGEIYSSDETTPDIFQTQLDEQWEALDEWEKSRMKDKPTLEEFIETAVQDYEEMMSKFSSLAYLALEMDGQKIFFNPSNVIWARIVK